MQLLVALGEALVQRAEPEAQTEVGHEEALRREAVLRLQLGRALGGGGRPRCGGRNGKQRSFFDV